MAAWRAWPAKGLRAACNKLRSVSGAYPLHKLRRYAIDAPAGGEVHLCICTIPQGKADRILTSFGLDADGIATTVRSLRADA